MVLNLIVYLFFIANSIQLWFTIIGVISIHIHTYFYIFQSYNCVFSMNEKAHVYLNYKNVSSERER